MVVGSQILGVVPLIYGIFAGINGWSASKLYLCFNGSSWIYLTLISAIMFPAVTMIILMVLSLCDDRFFMTLIGEQLSS